LAGKRKTNEESRETQKKTERKEGGSTKRNKDKVPLTTLLLECRTRETNKRGRKRNEVKKLRGKPRDEEIKSKGLL